MGIFSFFFSNKSCSSRTSSVLSCPCSTPYVILDTETTGLDPATDKIIQLSAIKYDANGTPIDFYDTYINPGSPIPARATKINGITDKMVSNAPTAAQLQDRFLSFIGDAMIVGYNVNFDLRFLDHTFPFSCFAKCQYVDALSIARQYLSSPDYKLETIASCLGFHPDAGFHDSFTDCEAVAFVLRALDAPIAEYVKEFHRCTAPTRRQRPKAVEHFSPKDMIPSVSCTDSSHPLFGRSIVFTGTLSMMRHEAAQMVADKGAIIKGAVSKRTDYLVVGEQDLALVGDDGMSSKEEKAVALNASGEAQIHIIRESEFLRLLRTESEV